jgi:hypothetical protein
VFGSPIISLVYAIWLVILGCAVGALDGLLFSLAMKLPKRGAWKDASLGACGMLSGFLICGFLPWPENTVMERLGDTVVSSTMNRFQHPYYVAFALALALPLVRGILRYNRVAAGKKSVF